MEAISPAVRCETHDCAAYCNEAVKLALWPFSGPSIVISDSIPIEKIYNQRMASALTSQFDAISVAYAVVAAVALVQSQSYLLTSLAAFFRLETAGCSLLNF